MDKATIAFEDASEKYRLQGGLNGEKRQGLESSKKDLLGRKDRIRDELRSIASQAGPLLVEDQVSSLRNQAMSEQKVEP